MIMEHQLGGSDVTGRHAGWLTHPSSQNHVVMHLFLVSPPLSVCVTGTLTPLRHMREQLWVQTFEFAHLTPLTVAPGFVT